MTISELYASILDARYFDVGHARASYRVRRIGRTVYILFEWSHGVVDWRHNLDFLPMRVRISGKHLWVHRGLYATFAAVRERVCAAVSDERLHRAVIAGYSHGAALAALALAQVKSQLAHLRCVGYGFGAPRVVWGRTPEGLFDGFFTVRCASDIVTHLPPYLLGYRHAGELLTLPAPHTAANPIVCHTPEAYTAALAADARGAMPLFSFLKESKKIPKQVDLSAFI